MKSTVILTVLLVVGSIYASNAQISQTVADRQFEMGYYTQSTKLYTQLSERGELNLEGYLRLGKALLLLNEPFMAESFLLIGSRKDSENEFPEFSKYLGQAAIKQGNYYGAGVHFKEYSAFNPLVGRQMMLNLSRTNAILEEEPAVRVFNMPWNSGGSETSISMFGESLVFTTRSTPDMGTDCGLWPCFERGGLIATSGSDVYSIAGPLRSELKRNQPILMLSYSGDGKRVAYVREGQDPNAFIANPLNNEMAIYIADVNANGDWDESISFPYNSAAHSNGFPYFNSDGTKLYFASNMKGGFGGFDLYVSKFENGKWSIPKNLGPEINSPGNEVSPFVMEDILFFSSDWHPGLGGLDVFHTELNNPQIIHNAGRGINSTRDDFGFFALDDLKSGFVISNRPGGRGLEDVYGFSSPETLIELSTVIAEGEVKKFEPEIIEQQTEEKGEEALVEVDLKMPEEVFSDLIVIDKRTNRHPLVLFASNFLNNSPTAMTAASVYGKIRNVYTIQVASLKGEFDDQEFARRLGDIGDVFKVFYNYDTKIRVGSYESREMAASDLYEVRKRGFQDAFIVLEQIIENPAQRSPGPPVGSDLRENAAHSIAPYSAKSKESNSSDLSPNNSKSRTLTPEYYVRLGAFRDTRFFDRSAWENYTIKKESSGDFTVILVGGFDRIEEIEEVRMKALDNGFRDAFIVIEQQGERKRYR